MVAQAKVVTSLRELDAGVAHRIFGCKLITYTYYGAKVYKCSCDGNPHGWTVGSSEIPLYSTDIAAAWLVVEKMVNDPEKAYSYQACGPAGKEYHRHRKGCSAWFKEYGVPGYYDAIAETAPLAISLAALKAKGVEVELRIK